MTSAGVASSGFAAQPDPWLGNILGRPALRLTRSASADDWISRLARENLFVTAKIPAADVGSSIYLQSLGFRIVDAMLTFDAARIAAPTADARVRFAQARDRNQVVRIAGTSFEFTRFHLDPAIPKPVACKVKEAWAGNFFDGGRGDGMVVAEQSGAIAGFLQLLWSPGGEELQVDLIAVAPAFARQGLARAMIGFAAANGTGDARHPAGFLVGTQAANVPSVRLYESLGFRLKQSQFVLHHHGRGGTYPASGASC